MKVIALDSGFGNVKVCIDGNVDVIQSAVAQPVEIGLAANGLKTAANCQRVRFDGFDFVVGRGAWQWGRALGSMDFAGLVGPERMALMYAAIANASGECELGDVQLITGLPVPLMQDLKQMEIILDGLKRQKRVHKAVVDGHVITFNISAIKVMAQPVGAWADWIYNGELQERENARKSEVAVVDLGMNTLDLFVVERGQVRPGLLGGDKVGVRRLLNLINTNGYEPHEADSELRYGRLKASEAQMDIWLGEVMGVVENTWGKLKRFSAVIPCGGGAVLLGERLARALGAAGAAVHITDDPVTTNVRGLWKYGMTHASKA